ncbi:hypothetical protein D3C79_622580 [compost metagenome]
MVKPAMPRDSLLPLYWVRSNRPVRAAGISVLVTDTAAASPAIGESSSTEMGRLPVVVVLPSDTVTPIWKLSTSSLPLTGWSSGALRVTS